MHTRLWHIHGEAMLGSNLNRNAETRRTMSVSQEHWCAACGWQPNGNVLRSVNFNTSPGFSRVRLGHSLA